MGIFSKRNDDNGARTGGYRLFDAFNDFFGCWGAVAARCCAAGLAVAPPPARFQDPTETDLWIPDGSLFQRECAIG